LHGCNKEQLTTERSGGGERERERDVAEAKLNRC
jgi:hypothetical protein